MPSAIVKNKRMLRDVGELNLSSGLTDKQVIWVKNKVSQVENLVNASQATFTQIDTRLDKITAQLTVINSKRVELEKRIKVLEGV